MAIIRINARGRTPELHGTPAALEKHLLQAGAAGGPAVIMIHGFKYLPGHSKHCPHRHIMSYEPELLPWRSPSWPRQLGFGLGHADEGLAVAFGWQARGTPWAAYRRAAEAGHALAKVIAMLHAQTPGRPVHVIAHSMGTELAFEALHHLPAGAVDRIISLAGASYRSRAEAALATPAGQAAELISVISRENDPFDFLFEASVSPQARGDRVLSQGLSPANAVTLQLDCPDTLRHIARLSCAVGLPERRICHWSGYTRPGALRFYNALLRQPDALTLQVLQRGLPQQPGRRWSRVFAPGMPAAPLPERQQI